MMNKFLLLILCCFLLFSCSTGDGTKNERQRADSLAAAVVKGEISLTDLANSTEFMYFQDQYFNEAANLDSIPKIDKVQIQIVTYRIFKEVKLKNNRYEFNVTAAKDLHIPNKAFVFYQRSFEQMNQKAKLSKDSIKLALPHQYADSLLLP